MMMPLDERRSRHAPMLETLRANTIGAWQDRFLAELLTVRRNETIHISEPA
jgi:trehalose-6-phosphate synthase